MLYHSMRYDFSCGGSVISISVTLYRVGKEGSFALFLYAKFSLQKVLHDCVLLMLYIGKLILDFGEVPRCTTGNPR